MNLLAGLYRIADALRYRRHGDLGRRGEDLAHRYLRKRGYQIVARNWRQPEGRGEIDLIAWQGNTLVFVEVKTRADSSVAAPERNVDSEKILMLQRAARSYLRRVEAEQVRIDVIAITGGKIEHFESAVPPPAWR